MTNRSDFRVGSHLRLLLDEMVSGTATRLKARQATLDLGMIFSLTVGNIPSLLPG